MQEYRSVANWESYLVVTTDGQILSNPQVKTGVMIVECQETTQYAVMTVIETSDDETVNLFIDIPDSSSMLANQKTFEDGGDSPTSCELLIARDKLGTVLR